MKGKKCAFPPCDLRATIPMINISKFKVQFDDGQNAQTKRGRKVGVI